MGRNSGLMGQSFKGIDAFGKVRSPPAPSMLTASDDGGRQDQDRLRRPPYVLPVLSLSRADWPVTLFSLSLILSLTVYEFVDYRKVHMVSPHPPVPPELSPRRSRPSWSTSLAARSWW